MVWLLIIYCVAIAACSWLGGWIPTRWQLGHRQTQLILSFVCGVMLGVGLLHLLPHSIGVLDDVQLAMTAALVGLMLMFFMIRLFHFHHHDTAQENADAHDAACDHIDHQHEIKRSDISWTGLAIGFSVHTLIDGVALAAAVQAGWLNDNWFAGIGVFLAIALHKPLDALTITSVMAARGWALPRQRLVNLLFALMCPAGALLFASGLATMDQGQQFILGVSLAFSAGVFLCISLGDLLPEVQFHAHDRLALSGMLLLGVAIAVGLEWIPGHAH